MTYRLSLIGLVIALAAVACGGGSGGGTGSTPTNPSPTTTTAATTTVATTTVATTTVATTTIGTTTSVPPTTSIPPTTSVPPTQTFTITISNNAVSPQQLTVPQGSRVTFVNNDSRPHEMNSDPHPTHEDCPPINDVGFLTPGQSKQTGNLTVVRTCGFHDHNQPDTAALRGRIIIQ